MFFWTNISTRPKRSRTPLAKKYFSHVIRTRLLDRTGTVETNEHCVKTREGVNVLFVVRPRCDGNITVL